MRFRAIRLHATTDKGPHGFDFSFGEKLTIVRANNSSGKSTFFHTLLYAMGMEELTGARGTKSLQSAVREHFLDGQDAVGVVSSSVMLEIANAAGDIITLRRAINSTDRSDKLVEVFQGAWLTGPGSHTPPSAYYLHDPGSAQFASGFFRFLERWLGLELPKVARADGGETKLYLQDVFAAHAVEQKRGWTDYIGNAPYFGIANVRTRVVEYVLGLDVFDTAMEKARLEQERQDIERRWADAMGALRNEAAQLGFLPKDMPARAVRTFDAANLNVVKQLPDGPVSVGSYLNALRAEHRTLVAASEAPTAVQTPELLARLSEEEDRSQRIVALHEVADLAQRGRVASRADYRRMVAELDSDIEKNESAAKLRKYGANLELSLASGQCPVCGQAVEDNLLADETSGRQMGLETNIDYLKAQRAMVVRQSDGLQRELDEGAVTLAGLGRDLANIRQRLSAIRRDLGAGEQLTRSHLRAIVANEFELGRVEKFQELLEGFEESLPALAREFDANRKAHGELPKDNLSAADRAKVEKFVVLFRANATSFDYASVQAKEININGESLLPTLGDMELRQVINAKVESSASDFVRLIWAYLIALYETATFQGVHGHHLDFLLFDEPAQHSMSELSMRALLQRLAGSRGLQSVVFASFENTEQNFLAVTNNLTFDLITWDGKLVRPLTTRSALD
ncbi:hypothetical protein FIV34_11655 [Luteibacter pinisoli]|uniref:Rad50/SbcC-type AAA domain-containing protein n=1 Tax=Luteibacter pinisoli TaxID=2589080 RepID=A0A4Y5Z4G1_9GAMM|nr:hypothetical protein [Luteibacter pinisoli]QDE39816.1 hypothetical protein FIV34_11655 [Luteibacter pinisoli]